VRHRYDTGHLIGYDNPRRVASGSSPVRFIQPRGGAIRRAAIYIRVSDRRQVQGVGLEEQERACRAHAAREGWMVVQVYVEPGRSAYTENLTKRLAFQHMLDDAKAGRFDIALVYKLDRFARKVRLQYNAAADLERLGVQIVSATEHIDRHTASQWRCWSICRVCWSEPHPPSATRSTAAFLSVCGPRQRGGGCHASTAL